MKKLFILVITMALVGFTAASAFAGNNKSENGVINLTDTGGGGPGVTNVALSATALALYSSTDGESMSSWAASNKSQGGVSLSFMVVATGGQETNNIYQLSNAAIVTAAPDTMPDHTKGSWTRRGAKKAASGGDDSDGGSSD